MSTVSRPPGPLPRRLDLRLHLRGARPVYVPVGLVAGLGDVALPHVQAHRLSLGTVALHRRDHGVDVPGRPDRRAEGPHEHRVDDDLRRELHAALEGDQARAGERAAQVRAGAHELLGDGPLGAGLAHAKQEGGGRLHARQS